MGALTYVVPITFILTVPAQALAGKIGSAVVFAALGVAGVLLVLSSSFWRFGLKHYTGASA